MAGVVMVVERAVGTVAMPEEVEGTGVVVSGEALQVAALMVALQVVVLRAG